MKKILLSLLTFSFVGLFAQIEVPQQSPKAMVKQTVGITDITIEYSSPAVKGRPIFGDLVPYNQVWRTGANKVTTIEFSNDVKIGGKEVKKGKYALLTIPGVTDWEIILNENYDMWGTGAYNPEKDVVRVKSDVKKVNHHERFLITITDFTDKIATINLAWDKVQVSFLVDLNTDELAYNAITASLGATWRNYLTAARYMLDFDRDLKDALNWINISISLKEDWFNYWIKALILAKQNNFKEATVAAKKSKELGDKASNFFYKDLVEKAIADWEKKK